MNTEQSASGIAANSSATAQRQASQSPPVSGVRKMVSLALLVTVLAGEGMELHARGAAQAAFERINRAMGTEGQVQTFTREEVCQVIGRDADEFDERAGIEVFRWKGSLKTHAVYVKYAWALGGLGGEILSTDVSLDADPRQGWVQPKRVLIPEDEQ
jgi:hypothetical protein